MIALDQALQALPRDLDPFEFARARAMLTAYIHYWDAVDCEVLGVEREFTAPLVRPDSTIDPDWQLAGKIDLIIRLNGRVLLVDHKTSSEDLSPGAAFRNRLTLNRQATHYLIGARGIGIEAEAFMFDVIGKIGIDPLEETPVENRRYVQDKKTKQTRLDARQRDRAEYPVEFLIRCLEAIEKNPDRHLAQIEVVRNQSEIDRYMHSLYVESTLIDTVRAYGLASMNEGSCFQYGGRPCGYHPVCSQTASIDGDLYLKKRPHEELPISSANSAKRLLTVSRLQSFNACRQRHEYRYEQGIAPRDRAQVLEFGTAVHSAAESYWRARATESVRNAA